MKYYLIAGEASGDIHASHLIHSIKQYDSSANFRFWGGDLMEKEAGLPPVKHYKDLAFMGFVEVLANLRTIKRNLDFCKKDILDFQADVIIFIDYPGFNLRIAKFAKLQNIKTVYYISPQIWAWKENRIHQIKRNIDRMLVILPFEEKFYARHDYKVHFVGHPLLDHIPLDSFESMPQERVLALLPGSRKQEIQSMLPVMLKSAKMAKMEKVLIAATAHVPMELYQNIVGNAPVEIVVNDMHTVLKRAQAALVTSGTATLETALFGVPQVVCYKASRISYLIARRLVKVNFISLVNLIMEKEIVREMIQSDMNAKAISKELMQILPEGKKHQQMKSDYQLLRKKLGGQGASERAASLIYEFTKS